MIIEGLTYREVLICAELAEEELEARDRHGDFDEDPELEGLAVKLRADLQAREERGQDLIATMMPRTILGRTIASLRDRQEESRLGEREDFNEWASEVKDSITRRQEESK